jgi:hypothetical protein
MTLACALVAASALLSAAQAEPPRAKQICIRTQDINGMSYPDNKTIVFRMNGGPVKVWRNELPRECPGLKFEGGIAWNIWGGEVCSNMQVFYVLRRGTPCMLGNFVPNDQPRTLPPGPPMSGPAPAHP